ncbi:Alpha-D-kanosaminyltransferase [Aquisphaera giovannonii]|uniref:Alpha-D-kanosaminyltransferase n=1 Tax=Aquisphaera giovannonii TaxID=406548 RepID=A0A5B9VTS7_9BACT|nr:glycosyltransferase [Aquisphaera giovannonii]QEH31702.1 Alpha-D-kanosaminyltransferase [Aquisphaera giovannonii]
MESQHRDRTVLVGCPDARPPAYQAVLGLDRAGLLDRFVTSAYYDPGRALPGLARRVAPRAFGRLERVLLRRHDPEIPGGRVVGVPSVDLAIRLESRAGGPAARRALARARTAWFDRRLARVVARRLPSAVLAFSDVASGAALPLCRRLGIPTVLSMVHGDVREEAEVLAREEAAAPEFFPLYLGDAALDREALDWLHRRRLRDLALADRILVPSEHIAGELARHGTPRDRIRVIPYAADCTRFRPAAKEETLSDREGEAPSCVFLFAGGICQRKGIAYLLRAWARVRRPGWTLRLLGAPPADPGPLRPLLEAPGVELLGRVGHAEMPARMAAADVFVFPSLFEGSAVVTYEALACGLPSIVTGAAGSVVRDGVEGFEVPPADPDALAARMTLLGEDRELRRSMAAAARARALEFDWPRYHAAVAGAVGDLAASPTRQARSRPHASGRHPVAR